MTEGLLIATIGAAVAATAGSDPQSAQMAGKVSAGVCSENLIVRKSFDFAGLPERRHLRFHRRNYGTIKLGLLGAPLPNYTGEGWAYFGACMPIALIGLISAILQARTAVSAIHMTAKQPSFRKGMTMTKMVETYAILGPWQAFCSCRSIKEMIGSGKTIYEKIENKALKDAEEIIKLSEKSPPG